MKSKKKLHSPAIKRFHINHMKMVKLLLCTRVLTKELNILTQKWEINKTNSKPFFAYDAKSMKGYNDAIIKRDEVFKNFYNNLKLKGENLRTEFYKDIVELCYKLNLGQEWYDYIKWMLVCDFFSYPFYNLSIDTNKNDIEYHKNKGKVILTLNPDTSIEDIKALWPEIKKKQKELWPNFRKENYSPKIKEKSNIIIRDIIERGNREITYYDPVEEKNIAFSKNDEDIVSSIPEIPGRNKLGKPGKRAINQLRQTRHRMKK